MTETYKPLSPVEFAKRKKLIFHTSKSHAEYERRLALLDIEYRKPDPASIKPPHDPRFFLANIAILFATRHNKLRRPLTRQERLAKLAKLFRCSPDKLLAICQEPSSRAFQRRFERVFAPRVVACGPRNENLCPVERGFDAATMARAIISLTAEPYQPPETHVLTDQERRVRDQFIDRMADLAKRFHPSK